MHSPGASCRTKDRWNISGGGPRFGSPKLAVGALYVRAFYECVGVRMIRDVLTLAAFCVLLLMAARPAQAQSETVLHNFTEGADGGLPDSSLTSDGAGNFYGTTGAGGVCPRLPFGC